ncbi:MAG: crotonase/enoyl-CoA hydratase family protein [Sphingopyxis sp.]|nr:crotonase/enoyl-CoA hydratase family protein [Sphingopyxis sp.]
MTIYFETDGPVAIVTIDRPDVANAIDGPTGAALADAFRRFEADPALSVAVLTGGAGRFCAGNDLKSMMSNDPGRKIRVDRKGDAPCGVTRMLLSKPVIAAVEGFAVAGGLEIACWCDLRVAAEDAVFGVYCRRWGIPMMDGGTIRLTRLIGHSQALDMMMTGRGVSGQEALSFGLANRLTPKGKALAVALELAHQLAALPQAALRSDRISSYQQWNLDLPAALENEYDHGVATVATREIVGGLARFASGDWREQPLS